MGEAIALLTGLLWAVGVIFFKKSGATIGPFALNLFKNVIALILLISTVAAAGFPLFPKVPNHHLVLFIVSGVIGIGISDFLFLKMMSLLGASRAALVDCLYSPSIIVLSFFMYGEMLSTLQAVGGLIIFSGVFLSSVSKFDTAVSGKTFLWGAFLGLLSMLTVAWAVLVIKPILPLYPLPWLSCVRMLGGVLIVLLAWPFHPQRKEIASVFRPQTGWKFLIPGAIFGSYLSLMAWLAGFKYAQSGVVALLNQMSTVVIVVLAAIFLEEQMTQLKMVAVLFAIIGATLVVFGGHTTGPELIGFLNAGGS